MTTAYLDTDPIIRFLTGDDPAKQEASYRLFRRVREGTLTLVAPVSVIADAVFVLSSPRTYRQSRQQVVSALVPLVELPGFHVEQKRMVLHALDLYLSTSIDFSDALLVAEMERAGIQTLYSYDRHFDRIPGVRRISPDAADPRSNGI